MSRHDIFVCNDCVIIYFSLLVCKSISVCVCIFENVASRSQLVKDRNKDRSRSKSPFRSFRWKKSPQKSPLSAVSASDDEATIELASGIVNLKCGTVTKSPHVSLYA